MERTCKLYQKRSWTRVPTVPPDAKNHQNLTFVCTEETIRVVMCWISRQILSKPSNKSLDLDQSNFNSFPFHHKIILVKHIGIKTNKWWKLDLCVYPQLVWSFCFWPVAICEKSKTVKDKFTLQQWWCPAELQHWTDTDLLWMWLNHLTFSLWKKVMVKKRSVTEYQCTTSPPQGEAEDESSSPPINTSRGHLWQAAGPCSIQEQPHWTAKWTPTPQQCSFPPKKKCNLMHRSQIHDETAHICFELIF